MSELKDRIDVFVKHADSVTKEYWERQGFTFAPPPTHQADFISGKWCRIVTVENGQPRSVYAFVCLQDGFTKALGTVKAGDIHKAASFKAPAKHARGNVMQDGFNNCATPHGIVYL
ncbi:MAG: hypothetical protein FJ267_15455 [Planctomycetes bacterium]|nr:hypothetical protein [Planctomycetota bacterium]